MQKESDQEQDTASVVHDGDGGGAADGNITGQLIVCQEVTVCISKSNKEVHLISPNTTYKRLSWFLPRSLLIAPWG